MNDKTTRRYDATARRARAEEERRATKQRVVEAARRLFLANGYSGTTVADIASEAGVAVQSVYKAGRSKAALLQLVIDAAVAGDDDDVQILDRDPFRAVVEEPDPTRQVAMIAALIASTQERSAPMQVVFREAAAVDETIAANLDAELERRRETFAALIAAIPEDRLRHSREESTDLAWAIGSSEVFLLLRTRRGWDADHYAASLTGVLVDLLLNPTP
jgi:AcrR family transcriptional regulator